MAYTQQYEGLASAIITDAYIFEGTPIEPGIVPSKRFFTQCLLGHRCRGNHYLASRGRGTQLGTLRAHQPHGHRRR